LKIENCKLVIGKERRRWSVAVRIVAVSLLMICGVAAQAQPLSNALFSNQKYGIQVTTNGVIVWPTNLFTTNANLFPPGNGSGDMLRVNNLSDVANPTTARANIGAETKRTYNVLDYGADYFGLIDSTLAIRNCIAAAGVKGEVVYPPGGTFLHAGALEPLSDQTWLLVGATLKRANESTVAFVTPITTLSGLHTITVASTNGFFVGMDVTVFNGASFDPDNHRITAMTSTTITFGTDFTVSFPSGGTLVSACEQIKAVNIPRVRIFGGEMDGNRANNTSLQKWQVNVEIYLASDGGVIRDTYIHDAQSEGIEFAGTNPLVDHVRIENCQGNGVHFFAAEHPIIRGSKVKGVNKSGTATGHADGCVIASNVVGDWIVEDCWLEDGISGVGSFDSTDNSRLLIHGCTFTNFTNLAIDAALPDTTDVSDAIITDNKFFNAGIVQFSNSSADSTSVYGPKNITFNNNILEDTRTIFTLTRGVTFFGQHPLEFHHDANSCSAYRLPGFSRERQSVNWRRLRLLYAVGQPANCQHEQHQHCHQWKPFAQSVQRGHSFSNASSHQLLGKKQHDHRPNRFGIRELGRDFGERRLHRRRK
jgi:hypothetical protein